MRHLYIILILLTLIMVLISLQNNNHIIIKEGFTSIQLSPLLKSKDIANLKAGQKKMTGMFKEFNRICNKYGLKYWCTGGTLIGVVRHQGWVPWDGDIDVAMLDTDFKILETIIQQELPRNLWFQTSKTDKYYKRTEDKKDRYLPAKIRDLNSCYLYSQDGKKWHNGLQLDIFIYKRVGNKLIFDGSRNFNDLHDHDYNYIFPLVTANFDGIEVTIPNKYKDYCIKNWGTYPPPLVRINKRYPHEGLIDPNHTCGFHQEKYEHLLKL